MQAHVETAGATEQDLLTLEHFEDVEIVAVAEFFEKFYS